MKLEDLKRIIDLTIDHNSEDKNASVLVTLQMPSAGGRKAVQVTYAGMGFDWESGQFRIETDEELVLKGSSTDDIMNTRKLVFQNRTYYHCPLCEDRVKKDSRYCSRCGQRVEI